jgi:hypothetical protein
MSYLGIDASGNDNNWTTNNLASTDQMVDTPTNNFCTLNPLSSNTNATLSEGSLRADSVGSGTPYRNMAATFSVSSGKWYYEWAGYSLFSIYTGFATSSFTSNAGISEGVYYDNYYGNKRIFGTGSAYGATWTSGDVIGIAIDVDSNSVTFYKNGVSQGSFSYTDTEYITPMFVIGDDSDINVNFGQDSSFAGNKTGSAGPYTDGGGIGDFYYEPPSGFLALCTKNLPDPAVIPSEHFNTVTYTGDDASSHAITSVGFQPDFVWLKNRSSAQWHYLFDKVRGAGNNLQSNETYEESFQESLYGTLNSFDSDGFNVGTGSSHALRTNYSGHSYVSWNWKANGTGVSNTSGTITSTVSANADAGFSIVSYTGTGSSGYVGHGLSKAPEMIIVKDRDTAYRWNVGHDDIDTGTAWNSYLQLNETAAKSVASTVWGDEAPTSTKFRISTNATLNTNTNTYIAYCFHSVDGYSKVGSYTGNYNADGPFVYTGFRPAYVMIKSISNSAPWAMWDSKRDIDNVVVENIRANDSAAEYTSGSNIGDFTANGFKLRGTGGDVNASSGYTYIYLAFAEHPFKHTNAR